MFAGNFAPRGYALCNGQLLSIGENTALFSLLGDTYGGDGRTTFGVPNLCGRIAVSEGRSPGGSQYLRGEMGGVKTVTLTSVEMPEHKHNVSAKAKAVASPGNQGSPVGHAWAEDGVGAAFTYSDATPDQDMNPDSVVVTEQDTGGGQAHENRPPYQVVNYIIALVGAYPPRS
jgi:microcystin-dependent protein